ncbi:MAG TPA: TOMM precursor leader peptide-binding protein [Pseudonocardia sp.]|jgi:bacteriocin biosynthesis cyclodehydratase domain-containing protein|nr:TOMM precursor leader peptide-binding protein [Pseudonocardia sp.]
MTPRALPATSTTVTSTVTSTVTAPSLLRSRPHHPVLRRGPDGVQLGLMPGHAVEATGLPRPLVELLLELPGSWSRAELLARARQLGADEDDAAAVLDELYAAGAVQDAAVAKRALEHRRGACVLVSGAGPLLGAVAGALAVAGVGTLYLATEAEARAAAGPPGSSSAAGPGSGLETVVATVRELAPDARIRAGRPRRRPDLAVLTDLLAPDPERHREFATRGVPQLVVRMADDLGLVGPLVLPGRSACLRCLDLHRADTDPHWPAVTARLAGWVGSGSATTLAATAALATEQALLAVDAEFRAEPPATLDAVLELDLRGGGLRRRHRPPHPDCGCGAAHTRPGDTARSATTSASVPRSGEREGVTGQAACTASGEQ